MSSIKIINGGLMTTVQDKGRFGYQASGMQVSGVMDRYSAIIANALAGNDADAALLETTFIGPEIEAQERLLVAVTGGQPIISIDGRDAAPYRTHVLQPGQRLKVAGMKSGIRAYIAIAGGIDVPVVMGSRSTNLKLKIGGCSGRKLNAGDILPVGKASEQAKNVMEGNASARSISIQQDASSVKTIRIVLGPQNNYFSQETLDALEQAEYSITNESDRMGYRLSGPAIEKTITKDLITDGIVFGSIQIPPNGQPIIMMADHQTTGGYPKVGTVISADLSVLAQCTPGTKLRFKIVSVQEAQQAYLDKEKWLSNLINDIGKECSISKNEKQFKIRINDEVFDVTIEEITDRR